MLCANPWLCVVVVLLLLSSGHLTDMLGITEEMRLGVPDDASEALLTNIAALQLGTQSNSAGLGECIHAWVASQPSAASLTKLHVGYV